MIRYYVDGKEVSQDVHDATVRARKPGGTPSGGANASSGAAKSGFSINPGPQSGNGPFGSVPGPLGLPDPAGDLAKQVPNLPALNSAASAGILGKLNGQLSPGTLNALKNASAQFGVSSGMPGSGLSSNQFLGNVAGASEAQQTAGIQQYNSTIPVISGTQTVNPALQNEIATQNSLNAAAPDPTQAASYAKQLFDQYLSSMRGGGGGNPGGGTRGGGSPAGGTMPTSRPNPTYASPPPMPNTPFGDGQSRFLGSSSSFEPDYPPEWDLPISQDQGNYALPANDYGGYGDDYYGPPDPYEDDFYFDY